MSYGVIYVVTCAVDGKRYVGQTTNRRPLHYWKNHLKRANQGLGNLLHEAIREHGAAAFSFEVIRSVDNQKELDAHEDALILSLGTLHPDGYNLKRGGGHGKWSEIAKQRLREILAAESGGTERRRHQMLALHSDPAFKERHRAGILAALADPDVAERHREGNKRARQRQTPEARQAWRAAISKTRLGLGAQISEQQRIVQNLPEVKARHREGLRRAVSEPNYRAKQRAGCREAQNRSEQKLFLRNNRLGRIWITNGAQNRMIWPDEELPSGWTRGVTKRL